MNRKEFFKSSAILGGSLFVSKNFAGCTKKNKKKFTREQLFTEMNKPVLKTDLLPLPVVLENIELRKNGEIYFVIARSKDGIEGTAIANRRLINSLYPIFNNRIKNVFIGTDARDFERTFEKMYLSNLNYKWQGLSFWVGASVLEFAVLDLLGKTFDHSVGELLGNVYRTDIPIYRASGNRKNSPEEEVEYLQKLIEETGAKAVKFRLGARMQYTDLSTKRDKRLLPLAREVLGDEMVLYADANGSYDIEMSVEIGKIMEQYNYGFFEEPVPFDYYDETREINEFLNIPIAGGEEESSMRQFLWMIEHGVIDVVQPDPLFFGGLIRAIRVARMADAAGLKTTPHMSGYGLGYLYVLHFASIVPNSGDHLEYKGDKADIPFICETSDLKSKNGIMKVPTGPGLGIEFDPDFLKNGNVLI